MSGAETQSLFIGYPRRCDGFHFQIFQTLGLAFGLDEPDVPMRHDFGRLVLSLPRGLPGLAYVLLTLFYVLKRLGDGFFQLQLAIGQRTAEELKKHVACCPQKTDFHESMEIKGRSLLTGLPVRVTVSTDDLYEPVMMLSEQIGTAAHQVLEKTPPELAGDIYRNGVMLTGGGAQLHGLTEYLSQELKVEVTVSPDPVNCVALGTAQSLSLGDKLETGFTDATPRIGRR